MRKAMFRAWDFKKKEWHFFDLNTINVHPNASPSLDYQSWGMDIGKYDVNKTLIYDGDIINVRNWGRTDEILCVAKVVWDTENAGFDWEPLEGQESPDFEIDQYDRWRRVEIIGNIEEMP